MRQKIVVFGSMEEGGTDLLLAELVQLEFVAITLVDLPETPYFKIGHNLVEQIKLLYKEKEINHVANLTEAVEDARMLIFWGFLCSKDRDVMNSLYCGKGSVGEEIQKLFESKDRKNLDIIFSNNTTGLMNAAFFGKRYPDMRNSVYVTSSISYMAQLKQGMVVYPLLDRVEVIKNDTEDSVEFVKTSFPTTIEVECVVILLKSLLFADSDPDDLFDIIGYFGNEQTCNKFQTDKNICLFYPGQRLDNILSPREDESLKLCVKKLENTVAEVVQDMESWTDN